MICGVGGRLERLIEELKQAGGWRLGLVAAAALTFAVFLYRSDWPFYRGLRERGIAADGVVTLKGLNAPDEISYSFEAGGRTYHGAGKAGYGNKSFADLQAGDRVLVFYVPDHPDTHCLGDPTEHLRDQNRAMAVPLTIFALALGAFLAHELRRHGG
jgi:hypothetical protein